MENSPQESTAPRGPVDVRLLKVSRHAWRFIVGLGVLQSLETLVVIARGIIIGAVAAFTITHAQKLSQPDEVWGATDQWIGALCALVAAHTVVTWLRARLTSHSVSSTIHDIRLKGLAALGRRDPRDVHEQAGYWRVVLGPGLEGLRPYFSQYLPALLALVISTPSAWFVVWRYDHTSGWLALGTIPLIPIFMVLIGSLTAQHTSASLRTAARIDARVNDLLAGSATLRRYGQVAAPREQLMDLGQRHAHTTMGVLRLAFLSSFFLEFFATLSVALVAVSVGVRLVTGHMELEAALVVLIVIPEVFTPLRAVGTSFHAAANGLSASRAALSLIVEPTPRLFHGQPSSDGSVKCVDLSVRGRDGVTPDHASFHARPGKITVLTGPNGAGKSTALMAIGGLIPADSVTGNIIAPEAVAYVPATPAFMPTTVGENLRLLGAQDSALPASQSAVGQDLEEQRAWPISTGQAQRVALARALAHPHAECLLLDEPSAHLSPELVTALITALRNHADRGATVLIASHDPRIIAAADEVVKL